MAAQGNAPVIIKRVKKVSGDGHHGGAWKVAYADFVTAMMAFFLLMWLLNATTEKQRKGIADYFNPTIPINRISGGGEGAFGGDSVFTKEALPQSGTGGIPKIESDANLEDSSAAQAEAEALNAISETLTGRSGESMVSQQGARHIVTEVTDEGLVIELFALDGDPLFVGETTEPTDVMKEILAMLARVFDLVENPLAIDGYVRSQPVVIASNTVWQLSADRAQAVRSLLETAGTPAERIARITGHADRDPVTKNPMDVRNDRIKLILIRTKK